MSLRTTIEWCDSTVNPVMGCDGCELWTSKHRSCYAGVLHDRYGGVSKGYAPTFEQVTLFPGRMAKTLEWSDLRGKERPDKPWLNGLPRIIFISDMADALSKRVSFEYLYDEIILTVPKSPHTYLWLTKRPARMVEFSRCVPRPDNLWLGASVTDQKTANARVPELLRMIGNGPLFLSVEPMLEKIDLLYAAFNGGEAVSAMGGIRWVIAGGESGPASGPAEKQARPCHVDWLRNIRDQCVPASIDFFCKQLGSKIVADAAAPGFGRLKDRKGGDMSEWPEDLRVRQFPKI